MMELRTRLFITVLVLLASAPEAGPQTAPCGTPSSQEIVRKSGKPGNSRSLPAHKSMAEASPGLCFQPGVGWQRMLTAQHHGSGGTEAHGSADGANPHSVYPTSLGAKRAHSVECPGILTDKGELGAGVGTPAILNPNRSIRSAGSAKPGSVTSSQVHAPLHPSSNVGLHSMAVIPSAVPTAPTHFASEAGPDEHADQLDARTFHAYISSIKLRKSIRNASDFRTRMRLQQLQNNPSTKLHNPRVDAKTGRVASRPPHDERDRTTPLRRSDTNGRPRGNPRD
jgi:hypothetical protein